MSFNKITIVGYLGRDPELRYTPQGTAVCRMSVATTEKRKSSAGQIEEHTTWFRVSVWGRQAELAKEYLSRGRQVYLEGRLRLEEYTDRDGKIRISPEVTATEIQFLGQRSDAAEPAVPTQEQISPAEPEVVAGPTASDPVTPKRKVIRRRSRRGLISIEEDGIPF